jgi:hypothetical protein
MQLPSWNEIQTRLGIGLSLSAAFGESLLIIMSLEFPYFLIGCVGVFVTLFLTFSMKELGPTRSTTYLTYFMTYQVASIWAIYYWTVEDYQWLNILVYTLFLFTATVGAICSYRLRLFLPPLILLPPSSLYV